MNQPAEEERFVRLEIKAAYLEKLALDLNEVIITQGRTINDLQKRLEHLERQLNTGGDDVAIPHEKPPHY
jgi:uncharacterized coiled-coil protein SlyX